MGASVVVVVFVSTVRLMVVEGRVVILVELKVIEKAGASRMVVEFMVMVR